MVRETHLNFNILTTDTYHKRLMLDCGFTNTNGCHGVNIVLFESKLILQIATFLDYTIKRC